VKDALFETERDICEMGLNNWPQSMQNLRVEGNENFQTKELIGYSFRINNTDVSEAMKAAAEFHKLSPETVKDYCSVEISERVGFGVVNPGSSWTIRPEVWRQFLNAEGKFDYTYSERMCRQIPTLLNTLIRDPGSRQGILSIWRPSDLENTGGKQRIPCSMYYQILQRDEAIHVLYTMRSCDIYTHFGFDVTLAIRFGHLIRGALEGSASVKPVVLTMFIGSLHAYRKDYGPRGVF